MNCVLLIILFSLVFLELDYTMGPTTLSEYVKIYYLMILVETFLNKPTYTLVELDTAEKFWKGIFLAFVNVWTIRRRKGWSWSRSICWFILWSASGFMTVQSTLTDLLASLTWRARQSKPAQRTRMHDEDVQYMTAMKDNKNIVLE